MLRSGLIRVYVGCKDRRPFGHPCTRFSSATHRALRSSFLGLPYRILYTNHKKELLRGLWVSLEEGGPKNGQKLTAACEACRPIARIPMLLMDMLTTVEPKPEALNP